MFKKGRYGSIMSEMEKEKEIVGDPLYNPNRHTMLMKIKWDEQGRPVFGFDN